jgi:hypothetical protein
MSTVFSFRKGVDIHTIHTGKHKQAVEVHIVQSVEVHIVQLVAQ